MATVAEIVSRIDAKIYEIINSPDDIASYRMGDKSVQRSEILAQLRQLRKEYQTILERQPAEDIRQIALDFDDWGVEESEIVGDALS